MESRTLDFGRFLVVLSVLLAVVPGEVVPSTGYPQEFEQEGDAVHLEPPSPTALVTAISPPGDSVDVDAATGAKVTAAMSQLPLYFVENQGQLDDHVAYTPAVLQRIAADADACRADVLLTTQKDFPKLAGADLGKPIWQLAVQMKLVEGQEDLVQKLNVLLPRGTSDE